MNQSKGAVAEQVAEAYLVQQGMNTLQKNYSCRRGEIDLIMQHGRWIVFVEVRYRKNNLYGSALDSVTKSKQEKIGLAALQFIEHKNRQDQPCRFDVVGITGATMECINWVKDAFQLELL